MNLQLIYLVNILLFVSVCFSEKIFAQEENNSDWFTHGVFSPSNLSDPILDAGGELSPTEISTLKGEDLKKIRKDGGVAPYQYYWMRVEVVRAIGIRKLHRWIPELIEYSDDIFFPKTGVDRPEVVWPCVWALAQIGEPSVEPILDAIKSTENVKKKSLLQLALEGVRGKEGAALLLKERGIDLSRPTEPIVRPEKRQSVVRDESDSAVPHASAHIQVEDKPKALVGWIGFQFTAGCIVVAFAGLVWYWQAKFRSKRVP